MYCGNIIVPAGCENSSVRYFSVSSPFNYISLDIRREDAYYLTLTFILMISAGFLSVSQSASNILSIRSVGRIPDGGGFCAVPGAYGISYSSGTAGGLMNLYILPLMVTSETLRLNFLL